MTVRRMTEADIPAGLELCRLSNWNQLEPDWKVFLCTPEGAGWVVERDGAIIGTVAALRYGAEFTWLSMMLVHPDARRSGAGTLLMETALEALAGERSIRLDATPSGEPLYRRFGFIGEYELVRAKATAPPVHHEGRAFTADVFAQDIHVFGADRGRLLASLRERAPEMALAIPGGYCFGRPGYRYRQIGPVVADCEETARELILNCMNGDVAIDVPRIHWKFLPGNTWLENLGFRIERPFLRMYRGEQPPGIPEQQFAITGPEFG